MLNLEYEKLPSFKSHNSQTYNKHSYPKHYPTAHLHSIMAQVPACEYLLPEVRPVE